MTTLSDDACYDVMTWMLYSDFTTMLNLNYATMLDDALILDVNDSMVTLDVCMAAVAVNSDNYVNDKSKRS
eukprot:1376993-Rhodomonas_salina.2